MWQKIFRNDLFLGLLAGVLVFLAFIPFYIVPLILLFPVVSNYLIDKALSKRRIFLCGFIASFAINAGGFFWVTYVIHEFGYLPWSVSFLIFLLFCGFGALNVPLFLLSASQLRRKIHATSRATPFTGFWYVVVLPAIFSLFEYFVPKLFPFYFGHCLFWLPWLTQIAEITGSLFLSFLLYSVGSGIYLVWKRKQFEKALKWAAFPVVLLLISVSFSAYRFLGPKPVFREFKVALIQANIGSLEKVEARKGILEKVKHVLERYTSLTESILSQDPKPDLIVWPETAIPFHLDSTRQFAVELRQKFLEWNTRIITGAYAPMPGNPYRDYNAAYFFEPQNGQLVMDIYEKNVLLAFGEFFPGGDTFPKLYEWFPQVSNFARGVDQNPFVLSNGMKLGITICYEAIIPHFFRQVASHGVNAVVNLTNDSWFGPTTEPLHHGALATFRSIETRLPLIRVTNTGTSFTVDYFGRMSKRTGVYEEGVLVDRLLVPADPPVTVYLKFGEWFMLVCAIIVFGTWFKVRRSHAPVSL